MKMKKQHFNCATCDVTVSQAHPVCQRCKRQMNSEDQNSFMDYVRIHNLRAHDNYTNLYIFDLYLGQVRIKGMTYSTETRSIRFPSCQMNYNTVQPVTAPGVFVNRLRVKVDQAIARLQDNAEDDGTETQVAA